MACPCHPAQHHAIKWRAVCKAMSGGLQAIVIGPPSQLRPLAGRPPSPSQGPWQVLHCASCAAVTFCTAHALHPLPAGSAPAPPLRPSMYTTAHTRMQSFTWLHPWLPSTASVPTLLAVLAWLASAHDRKTDALVAPRSLEAASSLPAQHHVLPALLLAPLPHPPATPPLEHAEVLRHACSSCSKFYQHGSKG